MGLSLSTNKYKLEHSFLPLNWRKIKNAVYRYINTNFIAKTSPCKFIFKEIDSISPNSGFTYKDYVQINLKDIFQLKYVMNYYQNKGKSLIMVRSLTEFIKTNNVTITKCTSK